MLCVEDDDDARALLGHFLRRRVGRLVEAADGAEALARFHHERPSLVITDIRMPGHLDGLALAAEMRRLDARVPIVVTTAFEQVDYLRRALDAGVYRYVTKPIDTDELDAVLLDCARGLRARSLRVAARQRELEWLRARQREALGLLAGGMSHDFNNLVQVVLLNLDVAVSLVDPDPFRASSSRARSTRLGRRGSSATG